MNHIFIIQCLEEELRKNNSSRRCANAHSCWIFKVTSFKAFSVYARISSCFLSSSLYTYLIYRHEIARVPGYSGPDGVVSRALSLLKTVASAISTADHKQGSLYTRRPFNDTASNYCYYILCVYSTTKRNLM